VGGQSVADKTEASANLTRFPLCATVTVRVMRRGETQPPPLHDDGQGIVQLGAMLER
jgi:hypothetical protein